MMKLRQYVMQLFSSLWFVPTAIVLGAIALAAGLIQIDSVVSIELAERWPRLFGAGPEGSREMLSAIASSMITVAGVTFSITIVALSLAASNYSPRILRNFMQDRVNQVVLGVFVGVFTYCIIVLRTIRGNDFGGFVPQLSVFASLILALIGIGFLIQFIHHIATSIQASTIVANTAMQTLRAIEHLFPQELGEDETEGKPENGLPALPGVAWRPIPATSTGYVQSVDTDGLLRFACDHEVVLRMERGIGDFVVAESALLSLTAHQQPEQDLIDQANQLYAIGRNRDIAQDAEHGIQQIVDVALKALSPGINDTTTAVVCLDYLAAILSTLASRRIESPYRTDGDQLRVIARGPTFERLVAVSFDQIRQNAAGNVTVLVKMLDAIETIAAMTTSSDRRRILSTHVNLLAEQANQSIDSLHDRLAVLQRVERARSALGQQDLIEAQPGPESVAERNSVG